MRAAFANRTATEEEVPARLSNARVDLAAAQVMPAWIDEIAGLRSELEKLRQMVDALRNGGSGPEIGAGSLIE